MASVHETVERRKKRRRDAVNKAMIISVSLLFGSVIISPLSLYVKMLLVLLGLFCLGYLYLCDFYMEKRAHSLSVFLGRGGKKGMGVVRAERAMGWHFIGEYTHTERGAAEFHLETRVSCELFLGSFSTQNFER